MREREREGRCACVRTFLAAASSIAVCLHRGCVCLFVRLGGGLKGDGGGGGGDQMCPCQVKKERQQRCTWPLYELNSKYHGSNLISTSQLQLWQPTVEVKFVVLILLFYVVVAQCSDLVWWYFMCFTNNYTQEGGGYGCGRVGNNNGGEGVVRMGLCHSYTVTAY